MYHEYGHAITADIYFNATGSGMFNGALNEGNSDVWAMCVARIPIIGKKFISRQMPTSEDMTSPRVYPFDLVGEPHEDGKIIGRCMVGPGPKFGAT